MEVNLSSLLSKYLIVFILLISSVSFVSALKDEAGTSINFDNDVNYSSLNVNNSKWLNGYNWTSNPYFSLWYNYSEVIIEGGSLQDAYDNGNTINASSPIIINSFDNYVGEVLKVYSPINNTIYCNGTIFYNFTVPEYYNGELIDACYTSISAGGSWTAVGFDCDEGGLCYASGYKNYLGTGNKVFRANCTFEDYSSIVERVDFTINANDCDTNPTPVSINATNGRICDVNGCIDSGTSLQRAYEKNGILNVHSLQGDLIINVTDNDTTDSECIDTKLEIKQGGDPVFQVIHNNQAGCIYGGGGPELGILSKSWYPMNTSSYDLGGGTAYGQNYFWRNLYLNGSIFGGGYFPFLSGYTEPKIIIGMSDGNLISAGNITASYYFGDGSKLSSVNETDDLQSIISRGSSAQLASGVNPVDFILYNNDPTDPIFKIDNTNNPSIVSGYDWLPFWDTQSNIGNTSNRFNNLFLIGGLNNGTYEYINFGTGLIQTPRNVSASNYFGNNINITGNLIVGGNMSIKRPYGMFSSTETQTLSASGTAYPVTFNWTEDSYLITKEGNSNFSIYQQGDYLIELSAISKSSMTNKRVEIWVQKTNSSGQFVNVPRSNTVYDFKGVNTETVISVPFIIDLDAGDKFRVMWAGSDTGITLDYITNTSYSPETPSVIMTMSKISEVTA